MQHIRVHILPHVQQQQQDLLVWVYILPHVQQQILPIELPLLLQHETNEVAAHKYDVTCWCCNNCNSPAKRLQSASQRVSCRVHILAALKCAYVSQQPTARRCMQHARDESHVATWLRTRLTSKYACHIGEYYIILCSHKHTHTHKATRTCHINIPLQLCAIH